MPNVGTLHSMRRTTSIGTSTKVQILTETVPNLCRHATFDVEDYEYSSIGTSTTVQILTETVLNLCRHATFDVEDYEYWDQPRNGDLHQVRGLVRFCIAV